MWHIDDSVVQLKRLISDVVTTWNTRLQELIASTRRPKKNATSSSNLSLDVDEVYLKKIFFISYIFTIDVHSNLVTYIFKGDQFSYTSVLIIFFNVLVCEIL